MKQEDKELLLKDLSARLPYKPFAQWHHKVLNEFRDVKIMKISTYGKNIDDYYINVLCQPEPGVDYEASIVDIKPYLCPISSMTEEEFEKLKTYSGLKYEQLDLASYQNGAYKCLDFYLSEVPSYVVILVFDWLNSHHFDYRGLIERGLAIAVTEQNNPYK